MVLSSSSEALVKLAFNLYNGFKVKYSDILSIFLKKKILMGLALISLFSTVSASATTYLSKSLSGTNSESSYVALGSGTRYLNVTGTNLNGTGYAMKIVPWAPDKSMTSVTISSPNSSSSSFKSVDTTDDGEVQSYYLKWKGSSSKATADLSFTD